MKHSIARLMCVGAIAAAALTGITACSSTPATGVIGPVTVDLSSLQGTDVTVEMGRVIDLTGDDTTFTAWEADISDPKIVEFTPGKDDGSAQFNPGLTPLKEGTTEVVLTNGESHDEVEFTVTVTPAK